MELKFLEPDIDKVTESIFEHLHSSREIGEIVNIRAAFVE